MARERDDPIVAEVRAAREEYAASLNQDISAMFQDLRRLEKASRRAYRHYIEPLNQFACHLAVSVEPMAASIRRMGEQTTRIGEQLEKWLDAMDPQLNGLGVWIQTTEDLSKTGWLPYHSAPFHYVSECGSDLNLLDSKFSEYYRMNWLRIRDDMKARISTYSIDYEARETFCEALIAHEHACYRCVPRVLFPEIERLFGLGGLHEGKLFESLGGIDLKAVSSQTPYAMIIFHTLIEHTYEKVRRPDRVSQDLIPNRHAAVHGIVPYNTAKVSMNMLILADHVFQILSNRKG